MLNFDMLHEIRRRSRAMLGAFIGASVALYFGWHAVYGDRGILAVVQLDGRIAEARSLLAAESAKREALDRRVSLLRPSSVDPDMLEERARLLLNLGRPDDVIILQPGASGD